jgi:hypothetical protein
MRLTRNDLVLLPDGADEARVKDFEPTNDLRNVMKKNGAEINTVSIKGPDG